MTLLVGMVRSKAVALLLGPTGVGVMGTYQSLTTMVGTIACMGMNTSGVREIAAARGGGDQKVLADALVTFKWMNVILAAIGAAVLVVFARPLSTLTFDDPSHASSIMALASLVFFSVLIGHNSAVIQGWHQIGKVAKLNVLAAVLGAVIAIGFFATLKHRGIVPALVAAGAVQWAISSWYMRSLGATRMVRSGSFSKPVAKSLLKVGGLFVFFGVSSSAVAYFQRLVIVRGLGEVAAGMFQAATSLSVIYASYVLNAMSTDFLPRLSSVASESHHVNKLVNEQTVVAMLLALPGIVATNIFAGVAIYIFYSTDFEPAIALLQLLAAGVIGRIVAWPIGIILVARQRVGVSVLLEVVYNAGFFAILMTTQPSLGLNASGVAPIVMSFVNIVLLLFFVRRETGFTWDPRSRRVLLAGLLTVCASLATARLLPMPWNWVAGGGLLLFSCWFSYRTLSHAADLTLTSAVAKILRLKKKVA